MDYPINVLVVDDEEDVKWLFKQQFRRPVREGKINLHFAHSGEEALTYLSNGGGAHIVLVLSDINMPGMTGLELLRRVKETLPQLPVHMITAYGDDRTHQLALEYGADGYLTKPLNFDNLKETIIHLGD